jgi:hypothetical protein
VVYADDLISIPLNPQGGTTAHALATSGVINRLHPGLPFAILLIVLLSGQQLPIGLTIGGQFYGFHLGCSCWLRGLHRTVLQSVLGA